RGARGRHLVQPPWDARGLRAPQRDLRGSATLALIPGEERHPAQESLLHLRPGQKLSYRAQEVTEYDGIVILGGHAGEVLVEPVYRTAQHLGGEKKTRLMARRDQHREDRGHVFRQLERPSSRRKSHADNVLVGSVRRNRLDRGRRREVQVLSSYARCKILPTFK